MIVVKMFAIILGMQSAAICLRCIWLRQSVNKSSRRELSQKRSFGQTVTNSHRFGCNRVVTLEFVFVSLFSVYFPRSRPLLLRWTP